MVTIIVDSSKMQQLSPKMDDIRKRGLELTALDFVNIIDKNSPIDHGVLHKWFVYEKSDYKYDIRSPAHYVKWVNDGHSQQPGRFIPGEWKGGRFEYQPDAKKGMVLKQPHVKGQHFVEKSMREIKPRIEGHFKVAISEVLG